MAQERNLRQAGGITIFRKKPVEIEARQLGEGFDEGCAILAWCKGRSVETDDYMGDIRIALETYEGTMLANPGDWIIRGVEGEFYPCRPSVFEATYERVEGPVEPTEPEVEAAAKAMAAFSGRSLYWVHYARAALVAARSVRA